MYFLWRNSLLGRREKDLARSGSTSRRISKRSMPNASIVIKIQQLLLHQHHVFTFVKDASRYLSATSTRRRTRSQIVNWVVASLTPFSCVESQQFELLFTEHTPSAETVKTQSHPSRSPRRVFCLVSLAQL